MYLGTGVAAGLEAAMMPASVLVLTLLGVLVTGLAGVGRPGTIGPNTITFYLSDSEAWRTGERRFYPAPILAEQRS